MKPILLGFEVGTGEPVYVKPGHLVVTGITQRSGKTTTLEALVTRSNLKAIAFKTKPGEAGFSRGRVIPPFFVERADWQYVESLLSATIREKLKFERAWIARACKGAQTLEEVDRNIVNLLKSSREGSLQYNVYYMLHEYFKIVLPQIKEEFFSRELTLTEGVHIMDLEKFSDEVQALVISSVMEHVLRSEKDTVVIVPECWKFIPEERGSPVKFPAEALIRQGASKNNYIWLDSIPGYEAILCKIEGNIHATRIDQLFNLPGLVVKTPVGEEIKTLSVDVQVPASNKHKMVWVKVRKVIRHPFTGKLRRINTIGGVIDLSHNHPIMKYPRYLTEAGRITIGDRLAMRQIPENGFLNDHGLFIGTEDLAWLYGFFAAEGWVNRDHVCFSNSNIELLKRAKGIIEDYFHRSPCITSERRGTWTIDFKSPVVASHFLKYLYAGGTGAERKIVPSDILNASRRVKDSFIRGYVEGDGHFDEGRGHLRVITSCSRPLLLGVAWLLRSSFSVHVRDDKPSIVQLSINKGAGKRHAEPSLVKRLQDVEYEGYLYDLEVESEDHTFYAGIGNIRVHNSQDLAGVDKSLLKQVSNWILGIQLERNEVQHTLDQIPLPKKMKPPPEKIMTLKVGHFYYCSPDEVRQVYVMPSWLDEQIAKKVAKGEIPVEQVMERKVVKIEELDLSREAAMAAMRAQLDNYAKKISELTKERDKALEDSRRLVGEIKRLQLEIAELKKQRAVPYEEYVELKKTAKKYSSLLAALKKLSSMPEAEAPVEIPTAQQPIITSFPMDSKSVTPPAVSTTTIPQTLTIPADKNLILQKLGGMPRKIYEVLLQNPQGLTKPQIGLMTGYTYTSGSFSNAISKLRTMGLIKREGEVYRVV